jgi:hypothetical protein
MMNTWQAKTIFGKDPVHLTPSGYEKLAKYCLKKAAGKFVHNIKRTETSSQGPEAPASMWKRARWVEDSEVTVERYRGRGNQHL